MKAIANARFIELLNAVVTNVAARNTDAALKAVEELCRAVGIDPFKQVVVTPPPCEPAHQHGQVVCSVHHAAGRSGSNLVCPRTGTVLARHPHGALQVVP